jgi:tRNA(Ile)-lysidine synthase
MKEAFVSYIKTLSLSDDDRLLLAVSGGVDSMVMLHLFAQTQFNVGVAHCNFQLRGQDSFEDEQLVAAEAKRLAVPLHSIHFDTQTYAHANGLSIQMAARELRYNWFEKLSLEYHYTAIATAHHKDDIVETFLLNLLRKTGIGGLHGIKSQSGKLIRPLLFARKDVIANYAGQHAIPYREDASNADNHYLRNYIRLHIIPEFQKIKPNFKETLLDSIEIISLQEHVYKQHIDLIRNALFEQTLDGYCLDIEHVKALCPLSVYLFEFLHPFGFNETQIQDLIQCIDSMEEKTFLSQSYKLLKTRHSLRLHPIEERNRLPLFIEKPTAGCVSVHGICLEIKDISPDFVLPADSHTACFDLDKIAFPLQIRSWIRGDYFYPLGGKGKRKLSDFFSDRKLDSIEKQTTQLLCNGNGDILWVMGLRNDDRYKITKATHTALICHLSF